MLYRDDALDTARTRSWRWWWNRLIGLLERDTETANIVMGKGRTGGPEQFEAWLETRAATRKG